MSIPLDALATEQSNIKSRHIDDLSTLDMVRLINEEDASVAETVARTLPFIAQAVDIIAPALAGGGRLFYLGAGTSGRLGVLDASECPPTFGSPPHQIIALIAGGSPAILKAVENAEDDEDAALHDLTSHTFSANDVLVGIAASGRTPYVLGGMRYARQIGAPVIGLSCNPHSPVSELADIAITPVTGAEVITGSSRMKAGTAQKMVLNMLSTASMIRLGKVFGNLMVDVEATNAKLVERQIRIVMQICLCDREQAIKALKASNQHCKTAILIHLTGLNAQEARHRLNIHHGRLRAALESVTKDSNHA